MASNPDLSLVIPCYNEETIIDDFIKELHQNISKINESFEVIFIDNKSSDETINKIKEKINSD